MRLPDTSKNFLMSAVMSDLRRDELVVMEMESNLLFSCAIIESRSYDTKAVDLIRYVALCSVVL